MAINEVTTRLAQTIMTDNRPIIEIEALSKAYGFVPVLKQLSLSVERGQFIALLGSNGSGKSTLLKILAGLVKPNGGTIRIGGWEIPQEIGAVRQQIGMVSHKAFLYDNLTAKENLQFFGRLYGIKDSERIAQLLEQVGLEKRADSLVRTFSRGMQQRLSIARALLHQPHILLFDEPYTGLDQDAGTVLDSLLRDAHTAGHTILMATHQIQRAATLADRYIILSKGKIAYDQTEQISGMELSQHYAEKTGAANTR